MHNPVFFISTVQVKSVSELLIGSMSFGDYAVLHNRVVFSSQYFLRVKSVSVLFIGGTSLGTMLLCTIQCFFSHHSTSYDELGLFMCY